MSEIMAARPMEAQPARALPKGPGWWYEPKWDGFRCLAFKADDRVELLAKSGKSLNRFFPEVVERLRAVPEARFGLDGELLAQAGDDWSFEVLQARLHPAASRVRRLAVETPAALAVFDMLVDTDGADLRKEPLSYRHARLEAFTEIHGDVGLTLSPGTADPIQAQAWLDGALLEGVVAKRLDGPYAEGERAMVKIKRLRSADCVVGGFRYARSGRVAGSLLLGLYDDAGRLNHVGFTSGFAGVDRAELTHRLEALRGGTGFTGRTPGGPSRWSEGQSAEWEPLRPEMVVEVSFDYVTDERFRHGTGLLRFRPDKAAEQCRMEQLKS
ncbi:MULTISPECIES: ATP-dependent DNA ligase [unclassified Brevundimonas]|uniref:ATP-dependent DNA ligase n=1 Tax=unclassified Brevundimonas TaxID=2622653 RepID=UPI003F8FC38B